MKNILSLFLALFFAVSTQSQTINKAKLDSLFQVLEAKDKFMGSIAISSNGNIIYSKAIGKEDIETNKKATAVSKYRIGSISKMFTSALIFKAIEEKKLSLDQKIDKFFPTIENAQKISIGNLLNHRSGINNFTNDQNYLTYNTQPKTEQEMLAIIRGSKNDFEPNSKSEYSNSNYVLLSYIIEKIYKKPFKVVLNDKIIKPLGLKNTLFGGKINLQNNDVNSYIFEDKWIKQTETDTSIPLGAGAIVSNPEDLTIFINQLFAGKIINEASLSKMTTIQDNYGFGVFEIPFYDKNAFGHTGGIDGFSSVLTYFPVDKLAVAISSNGNVYENNDVLIAALSSCFNRPFEIPTFETISLKSEDLDIYLGVYSSPTFPLKITISKDNNTLMAQATGQGAFPLTATKKDKFEFSQAGIVLDFNTATNEMTLNQAGRKFVLKK
jgi:D-alanyl-D-alanine carboxypeptidase